MQDDDKQQSFERLDETNPERNHRSFFDWLRGKEETDEEKLRKKLDEELKEAARKRATDFEEEQRVEEQREVAETRKLKKRWRAKLVDKSKKLLEEAAEHGNEPANGYEIAKLMVAERIVKLHDILMTEDLRKSEMKSIKIHIDFMGLLSEKLDRPELEVPEEVEQLYQTIAASVEETTGEAPPTQEDDRTEVAPTSEADSAYTAFAASIVRALRRAVRSETPPSRGGGVGSEVIPPVTRLGRAQERTNSQPERHTQLTEQLLSIVKGTALSGEAIREEISHRERARYLADVVERAEIMRPRLVGAETPHPVSTHSRSEEEKEQETPRGGFELPKNKKIKYLDEVELVALAETVHVGGGRLLAEAYKSGELDREGLIKVLESYNKGLDYRREFISRRDKWRRHTTESQEYLSEPTGPSMAAPNPSRNGQPKPEEIPEYHPTKSLGPLRRTLGAPKAIAGKLRDIGATRGSVMSALKNKLQMPPKITQNMNGRLRRQAQMALLLLSVVLVIIIVVTVLELSSL